MLHDLVRRLISRSGPESPKKGSPAWTQHRCTLEQLESRFLLSATLTTDQPNYAPGATAVLTGTGFGPNETVSLQVVRNDGTAYPGWSVPDDSAGNFTTMWTLPTDAAGFSFVATATDTSGLSAQASFTDSNPVPTITSLSPTSIPEGNGSFTLTVNGTNFISSSVVQWNGAGLTTTYVSSMQLTASVPAGDLVEEGSAPITVFNPPPGGGTSNAQTFTITDPAVSATGTGFSFIEGSIFTTSVATFTDPGGPETIGDYSASIDWGDGVTSSGVITGPDSQGVFTVLGHHDYQEGTFTITTTISHDSAPNATATATAIIADVAVRPAGGFSFSAVEGALSSSQTVATFTDPAGAEALSDYSASINWGDNSSSAGTISFDSSTGTFTVTGSHTYADEGSYGITVTLNHDSAPASTATSTANVGDAALTAGTTAVSGGTEGVAPASLSATFTDANTSAVATDFTATITWGDGATTSGTVSGTNGSYSVTGTHLYAEEGTFTPVNISITDDGGSATSMSGTAVVADAPLTAGTATVSGGTEGVAPASLTATFTDANTGAAATDFTATITWGDGATTLGTVSGTNGSFSVTGTHLYAEEGSDPVISIVDDGGSTASMSGTASVADAPLTAGSTTVSGGTEGVATASLSASFADANANAPATDFTATITWGDSATTFGTVSGTNGSYSVTGTHLYAEEGTFSPVSVTIQDDGGSTTTMTGTATVSDPAVAAMGGFAFTAVQGTLSSSQLVATFTDPGGAETPADYSATIDWGDGTPTSGADQISLSNGVFSVYGSHNYAEAGNYKIKVTVHHESAPDAAAVTSLAMVAPSGGGLTAGALTPPIATEGAPFSNVAVFHFTDSDPAATASAYTAVVNLGDGHQVTLTSAASPNGQIVAAGGGFDVQLSYTYAEELAGGTFGVAIADVDGSVTTASSNSFSVADASLSATGMAVSAMQGIPNNLVPVATFTDANPGGTLSDFTATIDWGDGSPATAGVVRQPGGPGAAFVVEGTHTYGIPGSDTGTVTIQDVGGQTSTATFAATVSQSLFVLNRSAAGALSLAGSAGIDIPGSVVVDSSSASAISLRGYAQLTAASIDVLGPGGGQGLDIRGNAAVTGTVTTGVFLPDPLARLPRLTADSTEDLTNYIALGQGDVNVTSGTETINPGIYQSIQVSGTGSLILNPGTYLIEGGGLAVTGSGSISGNGVLIYNAGSNFPDPGGAMGGITLTGNGTVNLTAASTGRYAGVVIFQARDNTRALSLSGSAVSGISGVIYAANALVELKDDVQLDASLIVGTLSVGGDSLLTQMAAGSDGGDLRGIAGTLVAGDLAVYINDPSGYFTADMRARIRDMINSWDAVLAPYNVTITEVSNPQLANLVIDAGLTSACGSADDGVLGCYNGIKNEITILEGWNWYAGADPTGIGAGQYDFATTMAHELGHALGLGGSDDASSPMNETLPAGTARRTMTAADLNIPEPPPAADPLTAAGSVVGSPWSVAKQNEARLGQPQADTGGTGALHSLAVDYGLRTTDRRLEGTAAFVTGTASSWNIQAGSGDVASAITRLSSSQVSASRRADPILSNQLVDQLFGGRLGSEPVEGQLGLFGDQILDQLSLRWSGDRREATLPLAAMHSLMRQEALPSADSLAFSPEVGTVARPWQNGTGADLGSPVLLAVAALAGWGAVLEVGDEQSRRQTKKRTHC